MSIARRSYTAGFKGLEIFAINQFVCFGSDTNIRTLWSKVFWEAPCRKLHLNVSVCSQAFPAASVMNSRGILPSYINFMQLNKSDCGFFLNLHSCCVKIYSKDCTEHFDLKNLTLTHKLNLKLVLTK